MTNRSILMIGSGPAPQLDWDEIRNDDSIVTVGVDRGATYFIDQGIRLDYAVGDFDSVSDTYFKRIKEVAKTCIELPSEKDMTDTEAALERIHHDFPDSHYYLYGGLDGRVDHTLANLWIVHHEIFRPIATQIHLMNETNHVSFIDEGTHLITKDPDMKYLSFISFGPVSNMILQGVKYPLENHNTSRAIAYISNEFLPNISEMTVSYTGGLMIVVQSRDA